MKIFFRFWSGFCFFLFERDQNAKQIGALGFLHGSRRKMCVCLCVCVCVCFFFSVFFARFWYCSLFFVIYTPPMYSMRHSIVVALEMGMAALVSFFFFFVLTLHRPMCVGGGGIN